MEQTIAAIATAMGEGGIAVVRISGTRAVAVADQSFRPRRGAPLSSRRSHTLAYGWVMDESGEQVDEALALVMRGPRSFTGEDVVELHVHGGTVAVRRVLDQVLRAGAHLAAPGEFTKRAFLNGRLDLTQAEAVAEVIRAKTDRAMNAALQHLSGVLGGQIRAIRERLLEVAAHLEAEIDFPELDLETQTLQRVREGCEWSLGQVDQLLRGAQQGRILREGFRVVLAGRPNVGKSSLMNRLLRENRAIVTPIPGTTRDVIEEWISLRGIPVVLSDTAGIRETADLVEQIGVERSLTALQRADLALVVTDVTAGLTLEDQEVIAKVPPTVARIGVLNKLDRVTGDAGEMGAPLAVSLGGCQVIALSAETGEGLDKLEGVIVQMAGMADQEEHLVVNARQAESLRQAREHLAAALETAAAGFGSDLISVDVRAAWVTLGEVTGETAADDLLDQIFSRFCIGK
ncbi:MAG TPA: tRNA uridine-5-carboxymethylaminomethyl(34) synthesis GTPase MnmE [Symbiobacteriaceae bacterium]|nr:tRNA uridine-5-carboxymethylaminomethyl(34) synthesis GTPase MnmE [Symbiobacteriaceae bacterium]